MMKSGLRKLNVNISIPHFASVPCRGAELQESEIEAAFSVALDMLMKPYQDKHALLVRNEGAVIRGSTACITRLQVFPAY